MKLEKRLDEIDAPFFAKHEAHALGPVRHFEGQGKVGGRTAHQHVELPAAGLQQRHHVEGPAEVAVAGPLNGVEDAGHGASLTGAGLLSMRET